jgi:hypothetical protein
MAVPELESMLTCPECGHAKRELMPTDACQFFYECERVLLLRLGQVSARADAARLLKLRRLRPKNGTDVLHLPRRACAHAVSRSNAIGLPPWPGSSRVPI